MTVPADVLEYLRGQFERGRPILFTGAGFSHDAKDLDGQPVLLGRPLATELWTLCFPGEAFDEGSSLQDIFHRALTRHREALDLMLQRRLRIDRESLPAYFERFFQMPWARIYTLNVDDLEKAAAARFSLPRPTRAISGVGVSASGIGNELSVLDVVHLNGSIDDGPEHLTFTTPQYAERLTGQEPAYALLAADVLTHPVVFVGTPLDEPLLWQHIQSRRARGARGTRELRPRSFLVTPSVPRARRELLQEYNVEWLAMSAAQFAEEALEPLKGTITTGLKVFGANRAATSPRAEIADVSTLSVPPRTAAASLFLLGGEPTWADVQLGRAIARQSDGELLSVAHRLLAEPSPKRGRLVIISGTAGSGKSTSLMRLALQLNAEGTRVSWADKELDITGRDLRHYCRSDDCAPVLAIDDAARLGKDLSTLARESLDPANSKVRILLVGLRSSAVERVINQAVLRDVRPVEIAMPHLTDDDIGGLIDVLDRENRLGALKGKTRAQQESIFREKAGRQLLVAMLEATSGRKFEEKVVDEWSELASEGRDAYALVAVAATVFYHPTLEDILVASNDQNNTVLNAVQALIKRNVLIQTQDGNVRPRHFMIAEVLVGELQRHGNVLAELNRRLAFLAATKVAGSLPRYAKPWKLLKRVINHDRLFRILSLEGARTIYEFIEDLLKWDFHYWLQRGSLEVEEGDIRLAENFLEQAKSLEPDDPFVIAEYAYMLLRKAIANPAAVRAHDFANEALASLRDQVADRGQKDSYPLHILGSQGLAWSRKAQLAKVARKDLLKGLLLDVENGVRLHPSARDLKQLESDLRRELLGLEVVGPRRVS